MIGRFLSFGRIAALAVVLCLPPPAAWAEEVITRYHSAIDVAASGEMAVTETIEVKAEGNRIRHGIFRDFPLTFLNRDGETAHVDFTLLGVTRDGRDEPYRTEAIDDGIRIYAGSADVDLPEGRHVYAFRYRTDRQIRYFENHDELYWNVTGNGWQFPILSASAEVALPAPVRREGVAFYSGNYGSSGRNVRIVSIEGNRVSFETTAPLAPGQGLSIVVSQPKGAIAAPAASQKARWFLIDNLGAVIGGIGLVAVFFYYVLSWSRVGRDPPPGVMVPRWDPPGGLSPALIDYVDNKGFSGRGWTALSASALQLAVKGYLTLEDLDRAIVLKSTGRKPDKPLPKGEDVLLAAVEGEGGTFRIDKDHGEAVQAVGSRFRSAIEAEHRGKYYLHNSSYIVGGVALSVAFLVAAFSFAHMSEDVVGIGIAFVMIAVVGGGMLGSLARGLSRSTSLAGRIFAVIGVAVAGFAGLSALSVVLLAAMDTPSGLGGMPLLVAAGGIVLLNLLFYVLMGAPTPLGRSLMDGIEGFRTYMTLAEKDRLNMAGAPKMSPAHYETLLPYAVALGVEKPWSEAFERWLATAAAAGAATSAYSPAWYSGHAFDGGRIGHFPASMAQTIASTIPAPKSNAASGFSSSGGFSGGGGGGGGGGGW